MKEKVRTGESVLGLLREMQADGWNVIALLQTPRTPGGIIIPGRNIVTNDGDLYYAQLSAGEAATNDFTAGGLRLGTSNTAPTKTDTDVTTYSSSEKAVASGYPKTNDSDADNTGAGTDIVTWTFNYATSEANIVGIEEGAIVDNTTTPTVALTHFLFAATFTKTSSNTLKVIVNHTFTGV
jgi:hypothetical protein